MGLGADLTLGNPDFGDYLLLPLAPATPVVPIVAAAAVAAPAPAMRDRRPIRGDFDGSDESLMSTISHREATAFITPCAPASLVPTPCTSNVLVNGFACWLIA
jgi:hypothetical protein